MTEYNFDVDIAKFVNKAIDNMDLAVKRIITNTAFELTEESPIGDPSTWSIPALPDYTPGHFLLNWQLGVDRAPNNEIQGEDADRGNAITRIGAQIPKNAASHNAYYIVNNASYARELEDGYSGQAPKGWVEKTAMRFDSIVEKSVVGIK